MDRGLIYIWTAEDWLYVAVVIDLFSRRVVGWSMNGTMTAQLVTDALVMAIWRRGKPDALLHHPDQGSQYTSGKFQRLMADNGVSCPMSRSGNVCYNAAIESFFSWLKTERVGRKTYRTRNLAKADMFDYIERFYNPTRRHSTLGYHGFDRQALVAQPRAHETGSNSVTPAAALDGLLFDGMTVMSGGFGLSGNPETLIPEVRPSGVKGPTVISNNAGADGFCLWMLLESRQVAKMISSYVG